MLGNRPVKRFFAPRAGFSLVELLTAIAVVALLVGLLVPALAGTRTAARSAACLANMRQWAIAANTYANDNKSYLPRRGQGVQPTTRLDRESDWFNALPPELGLPAYYDLSRNGPTPRPGDKSVWMCPEAAEPAAKTFFPYGMNMRLSVWEAPLPDRIDGVAPPSMQVLMAEGPGPYCSLMPAAQPYSPVARHKGRTGIAYLDAHAAQFAGPWVGCGVGDPL